MPPKTNVFAEKLAVFHGLLYKWYRLYGRHDLPWRNTSNPYHIYVSEVMLQQTPVKTVLERYYSPFLERFPTLLTLANSHPQAVTKAWEGLGYYTRAANLHKAAQQCEGILPQSVEALLALPGIGLNTAHAIASFAYGAAVPVMEANVKRVLYRVFALKKADNATLWQKAALLLDANRPFDYNQAMMDIGALVCTKRAPRCIECPLNILCKGQHSPELYPSAAKSTSLPIRNKVIVAFYDDRERYILKCRTAKFLTGLYSFMEFDKKETVAFLGKNYDLPKWPLGKITQSYSHFTLEAQIYRQKLTGKRGKLPSGFVRATLAEIQALPLSRVDQKILRLLVPKTKNDVEDARSVHLIVREHGEYDE